MKEFDKSEYEKHLSVLVENMNKSMNYLKNKNHTNDLAIDLHCMQYMKNYNNEINIYLDELIFHERKYLEKTCDHEWEFDKDKSCEYNKKICKKCSCFK